jgi:hypothetical protein
VLKFYYQYDARPKGKSKTKGSREGDMGCGEYPESFFDSFAFFS